MPVSASIRIGRHVGGKAHEVPAQQALGHRQAAVAQGQRRLHQDRIVDRSADMLGVGAVGPLGVPAQGQLVAQRPPSLGHVGLERDRPPQAPRSPRPPRRARRGTGPVRNGRLPPRGWARARGARIARAPAGSPWRRRDAPSIMIARGSPGTTLRISPAWSSAMAGSVGAANEVSLRRWPDGDQASAARGLSIRAAVKADFRLLPG